MKAARRKTTIAIRKPHNGFPLMPHQGANQWCKKFNGRVFYFGKLDDPEAAEKKYLADKDDLAAGRVPRPVQVTSGRVDVVFACNAFLTAKSRRVDSGEITERTWKELFNTCQTLTKAFGRDRMVSGLHGADFDDLRSKFAKRLPDELQFHGIQSVSIVSAAMFLSAELPGDHRRPVRPADRSTGSTRWIPTCLAGRCLQDAGHRLPLVMWQMRLAAG